MASVADSLSRETLEEMRRLSADQRIELALRLGLEAAQTLASARGISVDEAREILRRNKQIGRRPSKAAGCGDQ
jgi:hypothetical protein